MMKKAAFIVGLTAALILLMSVLSAVEITVGAGDQQGAIPINFQYNTSLYETVYLSSELNIGGEITGIRFYNNFYDTISDAWVNIWLGETLQTNLTDAWILPNQLTQVFSGSMNFPSGINNIDFTFTTPYFYSGNNLVMMVQHAWQDYFMLPNSFYAQTVGNNRSRLVYNDNFPIDPANPPATGVFGQFPKTTFFVTVTGMGTLNGTVTSNGSPLGGASVNVINTAHSTISAADGSYSFPYLAAGTYEVSASKLGYQSLTQNVTLQANQTAVLNFNLQQLSLVTVSGHVTASDNPGVGLAGVQVNLSGYSTYSTVTDNNGFFNIGGVYSGQTYTYTLSLDGYQPLQGTFTTGTQNLNLGELVLPEMAYPPSNVIAVEDSSQTVTINWQAPSVAQEGWIHYDSGQNNTSFGTQGNSFTVAIRFPPDSLAAYIGTNLYAVKVWPATGAGWNIRVWTGGTAFEPGNLVVDQPFVPILNSYNTVMLNNPVPITGTEELWFGYYISGANMSHAHAGMDFGPAVNGFGNMIQWNGNWTTLIAINSFCDFNWNIQGYVGLTPPVIEHPLYQPSFSAPKMERSLIGYQVWRLVEGQEENPDSWINLTPMPITATSYTDTAWGTLPHANYLWAVKSVYTGNVMSIPVFSNSIVIPEQPGFLVGVVRDGQNNPISGATIIAATFNTLTNGQGQYSLSLFAGTYSVTAWHQGYNPVTVNNIVIQEAQTTNLDFTLMPVANPEEPIIPNITALTSVFPNPFKNSVSLNYSLRKGNEVNIGIYNVKGQLIRSLVSDWNKAGTYTIVWDGRDGNSKSVPAGIYFVRMQTDRQTFTKKLLLVQ